MKRPILQIDFLALDVDRVRPRTGTSEVVTWTKGGTTVGSALVRSVSAPPGLILSYAVHRSGHSSEPAAQIPEEPDDPGSTPGPSRATQEPPDGSSHTTKLAGDHPNSLPREVSHRLSFQTAPLRFGERIYFACPRCQRRVRVLWIARLRPSEPPRCGRCTGARYLCDVHYRGHPFSRRRRALRLIERGRDLFLRPRIRADRRAGGLALLAAGETLLRAQMLQTAARAASIVGHLEERLVSVQHQPRSA